MSKKKFGRLSQAEISKRVLELETVIGQKKLAKALGVSTDSIRRYRQGKSQPQNKAIYNKINSLYSRKKSLVEVEKVVKKQEQIKKKSESQKYGRIKTRYTSIYPNYMYNSGAADFNGVQGWDKLEELSEEGYIAAWKGRDIIPLEVQFTLGRESLSRFGKVVNIVGITSRVQSPKGGEEYRGLDNYLQVFQTYYRMIPGLNKNTPFEERIDKIREFFINMEIASGFPNVFLGFYFNEEDDI